MPTDTTDTLHRLLDRPLIHPEDWDALSPTDRERLHAQTDPEQLLADLVTRRLLTPYQAARVADGTDDGLLLGNYRLLASTGQPDAYQAEHLLHRRPVVVKRLSGPPGDARRFWANARAVARLQHPHVAAALDFIDVPGSATPYVVTESVPGTTLEALVQQAGPLDPTRAALVAYQLADALAEAHRHHLFHRDLRPSTIVVTPDGQAKLLDFGLPQTEPRGDSYRAPEGGSDAQADLFGLGAALVWSLTGRDPDPLRWPALLRERGVSPELFAAAQKLLAADPAQRCPSATAALRALRPCLPPDVADWHFARPTPAAGVPVEVTPHGPAQHRVLIVDDTDSLRHFCRSVLTAEGLDCFEAATAQAALESFQTQLVDLVLLDLQLPDGSGVEVLKRLRQSPRRPNLKVIVFSGSVSPDEMAQLLLAGADYYLAKPFSLIQLQSCVQTVLRLKDAQDRTDLVTGRLLAANGELEFALKARDADLIQARNALVLSLAKLVESRSAETGAHLRRLQRFCRVLAEEAADLPAVSGQIDAAFIDLLEVSVPLHDIGKVALPDHILNKPGKLDADERRLMQAHTVIGAETLSDVARQHGFALPFLHLAIDIARYHHERYDGTGYPDRLAGPAIPLAARLVAIADVYDALRARRVYKPALSHATVAHTILEGSPGHFDPALLPAFQRAAPRFEQIFRELAD